MASDKHMEVARALAFAIAPFEADDEKCAFRAAKWEIIATALAQAEREGMKRAAEIAHTRFEACLDELPEDGDAYWQGAGSSALIIENAIFAEADNQSRQPISSQADRDAGSDEHLPVATGANSSGEA